ncbi:MAG: glycosyltransferase family 2 protein [Propionibacteriaceae bacterium]|jgi:GT2 family glycosyltransferase|nr:glycosyltransferase family 2 protein [Propionibacteriaceae bacterium]
MELTSLETASWFLDKPEPSAVDPTGQRVTAILVSRNGAAWLPETLAGLAASTIRPHQIIAVDNRSEDNSAELLQEARRQGVVDVVLTGSTSASFGDAVHQALAEAAGRDDWIWLLHDDAVPDPTALSELLTLSLRTLGLAIAVPLSVRPTRRRHASMTLELGASISGTGRRHVDVEAGEAAQGQYDPQVSLGGSTCGMLIRREAFEALHGFHSAIPSYRDGVDLGWRANLSGYRVMTCPEARFVHHQAGRSERRVGTIAQGRRRSEVAWDRLMGMRLVAAHTVGLARFLVWLRLVGGSLLRGLGFLLDKAPDQALDELRAMVDFVRSRRPVARLRRRVERIEASPTDRQRANALRPPWWSTFVLLGETVADNIRQALSSGRDEQISLGDLLGDEYESRLGDRPARLPIWVWVAGAAALSLIAGRRLLASGPVRAHQLLAAPDSLGQAYEVALTSPPGLSGRPSAWLLLEALGSTLALRPTWFVVALLMVAVPLTGLVAAWYLRHHLGQHRRISWVIALAYALLPVLLGGLNRGALWLVVLAIGLPFFVAWLHRWPTQTEGVRAWQPAAGVALALALAVPILPLLWVPAAAAVVLTVVRGGQGAWSWARAVLALGFPLLLWADWLMSLRLTPGRLMTTPAPLLNGATNDVAWQMLLGRTGSTGQPPLWISIVVLGVLWVAALIAALRLPSRSPVLVTGLVFIAVGVALSRFSVRIDTSEAMPDPSPWLLIGFAALLSLAVSWLSEASTSLARRDFGVAQALVGVVSMLLTGATLVSLAWWVVGGMTGLTRGDSAATPLYLAQNERATGASSLIVDQAQPTPAWALRSDGRATWGQGETRTGALASPTGWEWAQQAVAQIVAGRYDEDLTAHLVTLGVGYIAVIEPLPDTVAALDASVGLRRSSNEDGTVVWALVDLPTRTQVIGSDGAVLSLTPSDEVATTAPETRLALSLPVDPDLRVTVGGVRLEPVESVDWRATYDLGQAVGLVEVRQPVPDQWWRWIQLAGGFLVVLFALPSLHFRAGADRSPRRAHDLEEAL